MRKLAISLPLPAVSRWGRSHRALSAQVASVAEPAEELGGGVSGGLRAWFSRGQLGPPVSIDDARGTGSRC